MHGNYDLYKKTARAEGTRLSRFKPSMIKAIQSFITEQDKGYLVYNGKTDFYNDQIQLQSFTDFLQQ